MLKTAIVAFYSFFFLNIIVNVLMSGINRTLMIHLCYAIKKIGGAVEFQN